jgi:DNA-binding IclR family transcriptional regulator
MLQISKKNTGRASSTRSGIRSLESALAVLLKLAELDGAATLTELAKVSRMPPSKVHRYLASFINVGLVRQTHRNGRYDLDKGAVGLGLAAMARIDILNRAADSLEAITQFTGAAALLTVWGTHGPTIVRWQRIPTMIISSLSLGATMPLLNSASGRVFLAFAEESLTRDQLKRELKQAKVLKLHWEDLQPTREGVQALRKAVRQNGYATDASLISGHYAVSVPVFNAQNEIEATLTAVGIDSRLVTREGPALKYLLTLSNEVSACNRSESSLQHGNKGAQQSVRDLSDT